MPSVGAAPGRPGQHPLVEGDADPRAEPFEHAARILEHVLGIEDRRRLRRCAPARRGRSRPAAAGRCRGARGEPHLGGEAGEHLARLPDQEAVGEAGRATRRAGAAAGGGPCASGSRRCGRPESAPTRPATTRSPVAVVMRITSSTPGWATRDLGQVVGVERLVDDAGVGPVPPGPHQRGRDVARPGPHRDAHGAHFTPRRRARAARAAGSPLPLPARRAVCSPSFVKSSATSAATSLRPWS